MEPLRLYLSYDIKPRTDADDRRIWLCFSFSTLSCNVYMYYIFIVSKCRGTFDGSAEVPRTKWIVSVLSYQLVFIEWSIPGVRNAVQDR